MLQRFVSEDPAGLDGGINAYAYGLSDPTDQVDPLGLDSWVTQSGDTVTVTASITIYGPNATAALAQTWQNSINGAWNGFSYGNCRVRFQVRVIADPEANHWFTATVAGPAQNYIYVVGDPNYRSDFGGLGRFSFLGNWSSGIGGNGLENGGGDYTYIAHEAGHVFGLPDDYQDVNDVSIANPGHDGHLMASPNGHVNQHEINDILAGRACGCH